MPRFVNNASKRDPYRNFNFVVKIDGSPVAACKKMSGLTASVEAVKFRAGNSASTVDEVLPGRVSYEPVTLEGGLTEDTVFTDWANLLVHNQWSPHTRVTDPNYYKDITIEVKDLDNLTVVRRFILRRAWVSKFTTLAELAGDGNEVLIETLELQHEGFTREDVQNP